MSEHRAALRVYPTIDGRRLTSAVAASQRRQQHPHRIAGRVWSP